MNAHDAQPAIPSDGLRPPLNFTLGVTKRRHFDRQLHRAVFVDTLTVVAITYDPAKRAKALETRGLDFEDAAIVFAGSTFEVEDVRDDYGEKRIICFGMLGERLVVVGYTLRGADRHVFSMRKANDREQARIAPLLEV